MKSHSRISSPARLEALTAAVRDAMTARAHAMDVDSNGVVDAKPIDDVAREDVRMTVR